MIAVILLAAALGLTPRIRDANVPIEGYEKVPPPKSEMRTNVASATTVPWIDSNAFRYMRGLKKAFYASLPPGRAPLAAAEAFAWGADAIIEPAPEDAKPLAAMLAFLKSVEQPPLPTRANIGIIDDGSEEVGEVLNLMSRRNLLYRVVAKPDPKLDLNVQIGTPQYPKESIRNPNDFAARVRERLNDDKRLVRLFNTYTVIANLTGDGKRARVHLVNYSPRPAKDIRVRILGEFDQVHLAEASNASMAAKDVAIAEGGTEFTVPQITTYAVVDLERKH